MAASRDWIFYFAWLGSRRRECIQLRCHHKHPHDAMNAGCADQGQVGNARNPTLGVAARAGPERYYGVMSCEVIRC